MRSWSSCLYEPGSFGWPEAGPDWAEMAPAKAPEAEKAGPSHRQQRLSGALTAWTGPGDDLDTSRVGRKQIIACYKRLNQIWQQPRHMYVIQDTWSIHPHPDVMAALAELPRLEPIWVPTDAPSLEPD